MTMTLLAALALAAQTRPAPPAQPAQPAAPPPPACTAPEFRQFDFWVGRWDVYPTGTRQLVAHSLIERLYDGCAVRENWMPLRGGGGGSLNAWRPAERRWRQTWTDSSNNWVEFTGGMEGQAMVLTARVSRPDGSQALRRMTFTRGEGGAVRQVAARSADAGATWTQEYDFTYVPAAAPAPR